MSDTKREKDLTALIQLLDEPDEQLYIAVREHIIAMGTDVLAQLEEIAAQMLSSKEAGRLEDIITTIRVKDTFTRLQQWSVAQSHDLLEAWIIISCFLSPDDHRDKLKESVDKLYRDIWVEMNNELTALEKIRVINHIFYSVYQFDALPGKKAALPPYLLGNVLRMQRGNPLSLALLYLVLVQRLGMPVFGVDLPQHLILAYTNGSGLPRPASAYTEQDVLFYVNPFNKGAVFRKSEIELYLQQLNLKPQEAYFLPCDNRIVIRRLLKELSQVFKKTHLLAKAEAVTYFLKALN
jgi:regulator of sirC expression with transglutaminase-like and TPR domain